MQQGSRQTDLSVILGLKPKENYPKVIETLWYMVKTCRENFLKYGTTYFIQEKKVCVVNKILETWKIRKFCNSFNSE